MTARLQSANCHRYQAIVTALMILFCMAAQPAIASEGCSVDMARQPYYHLELTVSATFCKEHMDDLGCKAWPKASAIQLHGLWVDYETGPYPRFPAGFCNLPGCEMLDKKPQDGKPVNYCEVLPDEPALRGSDGWKNDSAYFSGGEKCLELHEWIKHGTCSPMDAATWTDWSLATTKKIADGLKSLTGRTVSRSEFNTVVAANVPGLAGALNLSCDRSGDYLSSLSVDYEWGPVPGAIRMNPSGGTSFSGFYPHSSCNATFQIPSSP